VVQLAAVRGRDLDDDEVDVELADALARERARRA
jgi:hypothetical protein